MRRLLDLAAAPYALCVNARNSLYDSRSLPSFRAPLPVVSVGNITLGGTGKTPCVEYICRWFLEHGLRPVILSRGYGSVAGPNDEARMLAVNLPHVPHLQGKDRVSLATHACRQFRADVLVLDDGFQHRRLARDVDIVLVDCSEPFGFGRIFPRGLLREPITSLRRADLIVLSRADGCDAAVRKRICAEIVAAAGNKPIVFARHRPTMLHANGSVGARPISDLAGRSVFAFCGIGNPEAFWRTILEAGCRLSGTRSFPDHHAYSPNDLHSIAAMCDSLRPDLVVTTQKDLVKIPAAHIGSHPLWALQIVFELDDADHHMDRLLAGVCRNKKPFGRAA